MPPSTKPELLAISFALFTHTYCELLDVSMESTARTLLDTFQHIYEPLYPNELSDLKRCKTTEQMVRITTHNYQHHEAASTLRAVMVQSAQVQMKRDELARNTQHSEQAKRLKLEEYEKQLAMYNQKYEELSKKTSIYFERTKDFPFLRRGRTVKWQLTMSTQSYAMLSAFLSSRESLFPMSALLQAKCELSIERRDPLPYTPACVIPDEQRKRKTEPPLANVKWAAPVPPAVRLAEAGESVDSQSLKQTEEIPFPPLHLDEEYDTQRDAYKAKKAVEFNRALLTNGFRRLEAIERKHDYEVGLRSADDEKAPASTPILADALKPSILLQTLCSSESAGKVLGSAPSRFGSMDATAIWNEPGVNLTCAKMCPPDGRRIAAGCDDAAIRIWSMLDTQAKESAERPVKETGMVLLGHKNGFPVFDVSWNRDGRSLLSAGGDGTIRLWDTMVVGPYGTTKKVTHVASTAATDNVVKEGDGVMSVPGYRPESSAQVGGTALALYRGHAPSCPVWSVEFAPSGYYFASAGADASGRIWTTDRPAPVRVLQGHTSASVNTITWHPNCNYVLTGSDDRTVRMWDIHNGRCVRLLAGCGDGVNVVRVSPSGKYAAGADYSGIVHIWDLGTGRKVNELRPDPNAGSKRDATGFLRPSSSMIHSMSYSACGTALATGGDDCVVRIWDARGLGGIPEYAEGLGPVPLGPKERPGTKEPTKSFPTRRTSILDLQYTKRNLLLACGKFATAVPLVSPIGD
jgi:WD40 repeat protein